MRKTQFALSLALIVALAGCCNHPKQEKAVDSCPDAQTERNKSFKQAQKEMKARNKELEKADKEAKKHNHCQCPGENNPPVQAEVIATDSTVPYQAPVEVITLPDSTIQPSAPEVYAQAATGAKFYIVVTCANNYPGCELRGCDNDGDDMTAIGKFYADKVGITPDRVDIAFLQDSQYSTANALAALTRVANLIRPGDYFLYWNSGHGAEYAGKDVTQEPDGLNQVICPQDFDWSEEHMITDKQLHAIFSKLPKGIIANWGSDSCHSGDLSKAFPVKRVFKYRSYPLPPPPAVAAQLAKAHAKNYRSRDLTTTLNIAYLSGCKFNEFSADLQDNDGRPCGGLTWSFRTNLAKNRFAPLTTLSSIVNTDLDSMQLNQHPQVEGPVDEVKRPFLQPAR